MRNLFDYPSIPRKFTNTSLSSCLLDVAVLEQKFLCPQNFLLAWEHVAKNSGCAGADGETIAHFAERADVYLAKTIEDLSVHKYQPMPLRQLFVPKKQGEWRTLAIPTVRDRIIQQALLNVLHPVMEAQFEPCSFAYRPGRSHLMAVRQVIYWRDRGYEWVLDADIVHYFDNVQHLRLLAEVKERLENPQILSLIQSWLSAGVLTKAGIVFPEKGIPQGATISPILANVYLDDFDEILTAAGLKLVRYADDFLLMARSRKQIVKAKEEVSQLLTEIGLQLHPEKTRITDFQHGFRFLGQAFTRNLVVPLKQHSARSTPAQEDNSIRLVHADAVTGATAMQQAMVAALKAAHQPIPPPLFVVLGYAVRPETRVQIESDEMIWREGMSTIYLVNQGTTLRREHGRFLLQLPKDPEVEIPIREVERILVFGNIQLTTTVISTCLELQIPVVFLTQSGDYKGHLWSSEFCDLQAETKQFYHQQDLAFQIEIARAIIQGKLANSKQLLLRLNRKQKFPDVAEAIAGISRDWEAVGNLEGATLDVLRGYEGAAAARYFSALGRLICHPGFTLTERIRRPPTDPMNSLLSFGYTLLFNNVLSLILAEGLNPYLGNLHGSEKKQAHLAFDLMEEFRSPVVDTFVMKLVNQKILKPTDFSWPNREGGVYLNDTARRVFLKHFEERVSLKIHHPDVKDQVSYRRVIQLQIQRYKRSLLEKVPYEPFLRVD